MGSSLADVAAAKAELLRGALPGEAAVLNIDNRLVAGMPTPPWVRRVGFGSAPHADVRYLPGPLQREDRELRTSFRLELAGEPASAHPPRRCGIAEHWVATLPAGAGAVV